MTYNSFIQPQYVLYAFAIFIFQIICACNFSESDQSVEKSYYYSDGKLKMKKYVNPETKTFEGDFYMWHKNGKMALKGYLVNSERHGEVIYYDKQERPNCYAYYDNGIKVGDWIYLEKGDTTKVATFQADTLVKEVKK